MSFEVDDYLRHIADEAEFLIRASENADRQSFLEDETLHRAFVRSLEVIGEAAKKLPEDFTRAHPDIDWSGMARMRDRLIHGYFGVDYAIVWDVVEQKIPTVRDYINDILSSPDGTL
jgi:uncharacterized protein with HEPN domain